jgi:hypothetical protein
MLFLQEIALVGATLHPMTGGAPIVGHLLVEGDSLRIVQELPELPDTTRRIEAEGLHIVPGLVDCSAAHHPEHDALYVAAGVTTVRNTGSELALGLAARRPEARDAVPGPRLWWGGPMMAAQTAPPGAQWPIISGNPQGAAAQVEGLVGELSRAGESLDGLVCDETLAPDSWGAVLAASRSVGLPLWGPVPNGGSFSMAVEGGQRAILGLGAVAGERKLDQVAPGALEDAAREASVKGVAIVPMLGIVDRALQDHPAGARELALLTLELAEAWEGDRLRYAEQVQGDLRNRLRAIHASQLELVRLLMEEGAEVLPGSGSPAPWLLPGRALIEELERWQAAGIPANRVLQAATRDAGRALWGADTLAGTLQDGAPADLVVLRADPTKDISSLRDPEAVVVRGRWLGREDLRERLQALQDAQAAAAAAQAEPILVDMPPLPEGAEVLLQGRGETRSGARRFASEAWVVARLEDGARLYAARIVEPATARSGGRESVLLQTLESGSLTSLDLRILDGTSGRVMTFRGERIDGSGTLQVERRLDSTFISNTPIDQAVVGLDLSPALTTLILGHHCPPGANPLLLLEGATAEPRTRSYDLEVGDDGLLRVRTVGGGILCGLDAVGAPMAHTRLTAGGRSDYQVLEVTAIREGGVPPVPGRIVRLEEEPPVGAGPEPDAGEPGGTPPADGGADDQ